MKNNIVKTLSKKEFATLEIQKDDFIKLLNDILESPIDLKMDIIEDDYEVLYAMLKNAFKTDSLKTRLNWMDEEDGEYTIIVTLPLEDYINIMK